MKNNHLLAILFSLLMIAANAQCVTPDLCNANSGLYSNDDAATIAYDNIGAAFHGTFIQEPSGIWKVWGQKMASNYTNVLSPTEVNSTNFPALTGTVYKIAIGSQFEHQLIVLTSDGLFVSGLQGMVIHSSLTTSNDFQKITIGGKANGLPAGVLPENIKMMFASYHTLMITTCDGAVYSLSQFVSTRGNGATGSSMNWSRVMENATTPLTDVIVARGNTALAFALKSDGSLWTWGEKTLLGNGTAAATRNFATAMTLPTGIPAIKMIQATGGANYSYHVLGTDKKIYSLGSNSSGQLGNNSSVSQTVWINSKNPDGTIITDASWISTNEHEKNNPNLGVIRTGGQFYTAGNNSAYMIGRTIVNGVNSLDYPLGISPTDVITFVEIGGHTTTLIKEGSTKYGYVGHRIDGSMGHGSPETTTEAAFDFDATPEVFVCGSNPCIQTATVTSNSPVLAGEDAIFTITGTIDYNVSYTINNGPAKTATIGPNSTVDVIISNALTNQVINLVTIFDDSGSCSSLLSATETVTVKPIITPTFTAVAPICNGETLSPLPTTSDNEISGTWSPALDNTTTTTYIFTPTAGQDAGEETLTITVNPIVTPTFTAVNPICSGESLSPLPTTSDNGISGTWSPALNYTSTTLYTFTPTAGQCATTQTLTITVNPVPFVELNNYTICKDKNGTISNSIVLQTNLNNNLYSFQWYKDNAPINLETNNNLAITEVGNYFVEVTSLTSGCVADSNISTIDEKYYSTDFSITQSDYFSDTTNVTVSSSNNELLSYQIDMENPQTSNIFTNIPAGKHTLYVTSTNGCLNIQKDFYVLGYPKFFTPNGDSYNDFWNIYADTKAINAETYIFDRYGKFIYEITPNNIRGWDGIYNDRELPSTDYWFLVKFTIDGKNHEFRSHFSLKR